MSKLFNAKKVVLGIATTATVIVTSFGSYTQVYAYAPGCSKEEIEVPKQEEIVTPPAAEPEAPKQEEIVTPPAAEPEAPKQEETVTPPPAAEPESPKQEETVTPPTATPEAPKREEMVTPPAATPEAPRQEETVTPPSAAPEAPKQEETVTPPSAEPEAPKQEETVIPSPTVTPEAPKQEETVTPSPTVTPEAPKQEETVTPPSAAPEIPKQEVIEDTVFSVKTPLGEGTATVEGHYGTDAEIQKMYELINAYRIANGKEPLTYNIKMNTVNRGADERAVTTANYWEHWSYAYSENIAYTPVFYSDYDDMEMVEKVFEAWIASEGHRNNILNAGSTKHETAISVFYKKVEGGYERYWVQCFR